MVHLKLSAAVFLAICGLASCQFSNHNQFGAQPQFEQQYQQQRSSSCPDVNGTYPVSGQCDAYIECKNGVAEEKLCPEGLLFNDKLGPRHFPCQYPIDVSCDNRAKLQPPQATEECPHQFGYFKMGDRVNCGQFMNCVNGRGFMFDCPEGLAFSQETYRCEWPDQVSDCDAEAFVGFTCPPEARTEEVNHFSFYRHAGDCQVYYICLENRPRMYRCGEGKLFNDLTNQCDGAENVTTCGNAGFRAVAPKPVQIQQQYQPAPSSFQQQPQFRQPQPTQKPFNQFSQFAAAPTTQPRAQFNSFNSFQQQAAPKPAFQQNTFQSQKAFTSFTAPVAPVAAVQAPQQPAYLQFAQPKAIPAPVVSVQAPQQPAYLQFAQPKSFITEQQQVVANERAQEDIYKFIQPRIGAGQEQVVAPAPVTPSQFSGFSPFTAQQPQPATRTIQPESPLPQTRSQTNNAGQFNWRSGGARGSKRYDQGQ